MFDDIIGKPASRGTSPGDRSRRERYLNQPDFCPYCGDDRFEVDDWDAPLLDVSSQATVNVRCMACGKSWIDTIELNADREVDIIDVRFD